MKYADFNGEDFGAGYKEGVDRVIAFLDGQRFGSGDPVACINWAIKEGLL